MIIPSFLNQSLIATLTCLFICHISFGQCIDLDLVAHYSFDGGASDSSINANHGTPFGVTLAADRFGNANSAYYFDGVNDYITTTSLNYNGSSSASISVWVKPTDITTNTFYNITRQGPSPANMLLAFQNNGTILSFGVNTSIGYSELDVSISSLDYVDGQWHCITAVYDGNNQYLFTDGVQIGSQIKTGTISNTTSTFPPFSIGSMNNTKEYYKGYMDDLKFYSRALNVHQINYICNNISPSINLGNDTTLCLGDTLTLNAVTPRSTYSWQDNSTDSIYQVTQSGTYWVEITVDSVCTMSDTINIQFYNPQSINLGNDTSVCLGNSLTLNATIPNSIYLWQDNSTDSVFQVTQSGTYWVEVTVDSTCKISDTIHIQYFNSQSTDLGNDTTLCSGSTLTLNAVTPNSTYSWQDNSTDSVYQVTQSGTYWVEVTVDSVCKTVDTINVQYISSQTLELEDSISFCENESVTIIPDIVPTGEYLWSTGDTSKAITVYTPDTYYLDIVTNCFTLSDSIVVSLDTCESRIFIPNTFTPNNDGDNDVFIFYGIKDPSFTVYNRWGEMVYHNDHYKQDWDGTQDNIDLQLGVYSYVISYKYIDPKSTQSTPKGSERIIRGTVYILR